MQRSGYHGQCLCGQVTFEADSFKTAMAHCHCSMCRKFHGAAFSTFGAVLKRSFRWLSGEELVAQYIAPNQTTRLFCSNCGSSLAFQSADDDDHLEIALATLDSSKGLEPDAHIYLESKVAWFEPNDSLQKCIKGRTNQ